MSALALAFVAHAAAAAPADPPAPPPHRLIDVPYLAQTPELCGGAAAAMVMRYWGDRTVLPVDFQSLISSPGGIRTTDLTAAVARRGWQAYASEITGDPIDALQHEVDRGRPVITLVEVSPGRFHYVVVVGVTGDRVVFHDPARTAFRVASAGDFDAEWRGSRRWQLLILPTPTTASAGAGGPAAAIAPAPHARAGACGALVDHAVDLADADQAAAEQALVAAADLCPADSDPLLELAGLRFRQSQWREAADLAEQATERVSPDDPEHRAAWQMLATSRFLENDFDGALDAWNHLGQPSIDVVAISGARRSSQPPLQHLIGLEPRTMLTAGDFERAARNFSETPTATATRLSFTPEDDGRVGVSAAMTEGDAVPHRLVDLAALAGRAWISRDFRFPLSGVLGLDEDVILDYRYPPPEPRYGAIVQLPAPAPFHGLLTIDGYWEQESYATPFTSLATVERDTRRRVDANLGTWMSGSTKLDVGAAVDRFGARSYAAFHGGIEEHLLGDDVIARLDGETWGYGTGRFSTADATVTWHTTTAITRSSLSGLIGGWVASAEAPRFLWMGAGIGPGRPLLLRAHTLFHDSVIDSPFFGRRFAFATAEYQKPVARTRTGVVAVAGFVDMGQAWRTLVGPGASPFQVDAGIGLRLRVSAHGGARLDLAHGLPHGGLTISAGYTYGGGVVFNRGTPW